MSEEGFLYRMKAPQLTKQNDRIQLGLPGPATMGLGMWRVAIKQWHGVNPEVIKVETQASS